MRAVHNISAILSIIVFLGCVAEERNNAVNNIGANAPLPSAPKGYELYAWIRDNTSYFTLITGTNRMKTPRELTAPEDIVSNDGWVKITVTGLEAVKRIIARLPKNEEVFFRDEIEGYASVRTAVFSEIQEFGDSIGVRVYRLQQ